MKDNTNNFFSFENNPVLGTARKAGKSTRELVEGIAREQIAGAQEFVDLSSKQFDALTSEIGDVFEVNREWLTGSYEIVKEHTGNVFGIVRDAAGKIFSGEADPVKDVMEKTEGNITKATKIVEEVAA